LNKDGWGIAWAKKGKLKIVRGFTQDGLIAQATKLSSYPALIHLRWATHGTVCKGNCHPFMVTDDIAFAHNGVLASPDTGKNEIDGVYSDTRLFSEFALAPMMKESPKLFDNLGFRYLMDTLATESGSRFGFLRKDGSWWISGEDDGEWTDGVWYSNSSYKGVKPVLPYTAYTAYTSTGTKTVYSSDGGASWKSPDADWSSMHSEFDNLWKQAVRRDSRIRYEGEDVEY